MKPMINATATIREGIRVDRKADSELLVPLTSYKIIVLAHFGLNCRVARWTLTYVGTGPGVEPVKTVFRHGEFGLSNARIQDRKGKTSGV
jgi:hypothetical protein